MFSDSPHYWRLLTALSKTVRALPSSWSGIQGDNSSGKLQEKGFPVCSNTCTLQLPAKACPHFRLLLDSGCASPAIQPWSVSHHGMIIPWLNHFCFLLPWPLHLGAFPDKSTSSCSEICWSLQCSTKDCWIEHHWQEKSTMPNLIISMIICPSS